MNSPTINSATFSAFADLTAQPLSVEITANPDSANQRHTIQIGLYEGGAHLTVYLADGSLEVLRDAIALRLSQDTQETS
jgi:hypothetical protein